MLKKCAFITALVLALSPATAKADWLFTPNLGAAFGGDTAGSSRLAYGLALGWMGEGAVGWEADFSYTPQFFERTDADFQFTSDRNVVSVMGNMIVGIPVGGQLGAGFRPYVTGGLGLIQREESGPVELFTVNRNEFGMNVGAGAFAFMSDRVGLRGDVRYLRSLTVPEGPDLLGVGRLDYWRGTGGITFRW